MGHVSKSKYDSACLHFQVKVSQECFDNVYPTTSICSKPCLSWVVGQRHQDMSLGFKKKKKKVSLR